MLGIAPNLDAPGFVKADITPFFFEHLDFAEGYCDTVRGRISVRWERIGEKIKLTAKADGSIDACLFGEKMPKNTEIIRFFEAK